MQSTDIIIHSNRLPQKIQSSMQNISNAHYSKMHFIYKSVFYTTDTISSIIFAFYNVKHIFSSSDMCSLGLYADVKFCSLTALNHFPRTGTLYP